MLTYFEMGEHVTSEPGESGPGDGGTKGGGWGVIALFNVVTRSSHLCLFYS